MSIISKYNQANISSMWITIISLILIGICLIVISHSAKKRKRTIWQIIVGFLIILFTLSLYNMTIVNPNELSACTYFKYEKQYNRNNKKHNIITKHFSVRHIDDNTYNSIDFNNAIVNAPHNNKVGKIHLWNWL